MRFRSIRSTVLEVMANNAIYEFKVVSFDKKSFDGSMWAPVKNGDGRQPLVKTGRMRESITVISKTQDMRRVGSLVPYASYHNNGTKNIPKRQFVGETKALLRKNKKALMEFLRRGLEAKRPHL